ncbi:urea transporter [Microbacterium luticocti]|uniref:urea transporter n=1 Tax=Microbacterium luticocti TaxID=451764 RepID=UPI000411BCA0|nr:urea transporter [Microbacterium luticocti]
MTTAGARTATPLAQWGVGVLNGASQIYFQTNWACGILILAAFVVADWRMAVLAVIGGVGGMLGGRACGNGLANIAAGMQSFCGTLVGAAVFAALGGNGWWCYLLAFLGGLVTGPVTWVIVKLFASPALKRFELPYTTAPFCITATVITVSTLRLAVPAPASHLPDQPVAAFFTSLLTNVSQVVLVDNVFSGALILLGLFIASWKVGLAAVLGSALGSLTAMAMGEPWSEIANGLANYSGVLTAIALTVTFVTASRASWLYSLPWIVITAVVTVLMHRAGLVTYTWPYILTTWAALIIAFYVTSLRRT